MNLPAGMNQCEDFLRFESALKEMRLLDDKIIYALNTAIPTASFKGHSDASQKCQDLSKQVRICQLPVLLVAIHTMLF